MAQPLTLFQKVWNTHIVAQEPDSPAILYIDLQLVHEVTSPQAFDGLRKRKLKVRRPDKTVGTMDHSIPTLPPSVPVSDELAAKQMRQM
jgi:3-isopropylmalate/(R)-2-methylmalate dehydratase large subunit